VIDCLSPVCKPGCQAVQIALEPFGIITL